MDRLWLTISTWQVPCSVVEDVNTVGYRDLCTNSKNFRKSDLRRYVRLARLAGVYIADLHLGGVHLGSVHLGDVYLTGVYLIGVHLR